MPKPWEKYQSATAEGPWAKYQTKEEPGLLQRAGGAIMGAIRGDPAEDLPEQMALPSDPAKAQAKIDRWNMDATLGEDQYGNPTVTMDGKTSLLNRPGLSVKDVTDLPQKFIDFAAKTGPYIAGGAALAPLRAAIAAPAAAGMGTTLNAAQQRAEITVGQRQEFDPWEALKTGVFMATGDLGGRALVGTLAGIVSRSRPGIKVLDEQGAFTDEAMNILRQMDEGQLDQRIAKELSDKGALTAEQAERFNLFKKAGMQPTRANVTQSVDDWKVQQEAMKSDGSLRDIVEQQNQALFNLTDDAITGTGAKTADAYATGASVADFVTDNAVKLDKGISRLYKQADEMASGERVVDLDNLRGALSRFAGDNQLSGGVISSVRNTLKQRGLEGKRNTVTQAIRNRVSPREAEGIRQELNKIFEAANGRGKQIVRQLKDSLDEDVFRAVGDDFYQQARGAKAQFERDLSPDLASKFDKTRRSTPRDILEGRIQPDDVFRKSVTSGKVRDLADTKRYLLKHPEGKQAWDNIRGETVRHLQQKAMVSHGAEGANFSGRKFRDALDKIGNEKLKLLFSEAELSQLGTISRLGELRIPDSAVQQGLGPTAQAFKEFGEETFGVRQLMRLINGYRGARQTSAAANPGQTTAKALSGLPARQAAKPLMPIVPLASGGASQSPR